jgi:Holliday junction resolvase RusA-like endonuclease
MTTYDGDPYRIMCWVGGDRRRHIQLEMWRDVPSAVHMTRVSMHTNEAARAYVAWRQATTIMVRDILRRENIDPFGEGPLKARVKIELAPMVTHRRYLSGKVGEVMTHPARERDLKNLVWALEDGLQGALFKNDKWIDEWKASKAEADEDRFVVEIWESGVSSNGR